MSRGNAARWAALPLLLLTCMAGGACGGGHDAVERELDALRADILRLRADNASLRERLDVSDLSTPPAPSVGSAATAAGAPPPATSQSLPSPNPRPGASAAPSTPTLAALPGERPPLEVVKLVPDETSEDDGDGVARTILRSTPGGGIVEELAPTTREEAPAVQKAYEDAVAAYRAKQWVRALDTLGAFVIEHAEHPLADDAMYFRACVYLAKGELRGGAEALESLLTRYPTTNRAPEALADLSETYRRLGENEAAETARSRLSAQFPGSEAARKSQEDGGRKRSKKSSSKEAQGARP